MRPNAKLSAAEELRSAITAATQTISDNQTKEVCGVNFSN
jgi:hypothetical protein